MPQHIEKATKEHLTIALRTYGIGFTLTSFLNDKFIHDQQHVETGS
jgi:hypothetical protein